MQCNRIRGLGLAQNWIPRVFKEFLKVLASIQTETREKKEICLCYKNTTVMEILARRRFRVTIKLGRTQCKQTSQALTTPSKKEEQESNFSQVQP